MEAKKVFSEALRSGLYVEHARPVGMLSAERPKCYEVCDANGVLYASADTQDEAINKAWPKFQRRLESQERTRRK